MIKKVLVIVAFILATTAHAMESAALLSEPQSKPVEYPHDIYGWFLHFRLLPVDLQRKLIQYRAATLEPSIVIEKPGITGYLRVENLALSNDSEWLAYTSITSDEELFLLNLHTLESKKALRIMPCISGLVFTPDDKQIAVVDGGCEGEGFHLHRIGKDEETNTFKDNAEMYPKGHTLYMDEGGLKNAVLCICIGAISQNELILADNHRKIFRYNLEKNLVQPLHADECHHPARDIFDFPTNCHNRVIFCGIDSNFDVIAVSKTNTVERFDMHTRQWHELLHLTDQLEKRHFTYKLGKRQYFDVKGKWLIAFNQLIDLESKECRDLVNVEVDGVKFNPDGRLIFMRLQDDCSPAIYHRTTSACVARGHPENKMLKHLCGAAINDKFLVTCVGNYSWLGNSKLSKDSLLDKVSIYPLRPVINYHTRFQERLCSLDILVFVMFLDDLFQQGIVLKNSRLELTETPLVRIVAYEVFQVPAHEDAGHVPFTESGGVDLYKNPKRYTIVMKKAQAYEILKKARLRIVKADVQSCCADNPEIASLDPERKVAALRQLSDSSIQTLKALWDLLGSDEQEALNKAYETIF